MSRDPLGLRRALSGLLLPGLVGAMALLAALVVSGAESAAALAQRWQQGALTAITVQLPSADPAALARAEAALRATPEVAQARIVDPARLAHLLQPWLGEASTIPLPGLIEVELHETRRDPDLLAARLAAVVPGAAIEFHGVWVQRLASLARSLQALAWAVLALVAAVAVAVVAVATRAGIAARRDAIEVLHGLGARDGDIAGRFARRLGALAALGAVCGVAAAVPALALLSDLATPWLGVEEARSGLASLPWGILLALPAIAFVIGWSTAQATVRRWLRRFP
jgi:cell division transport system permease protein